MQTRSDWLNEDVPHVYIASANADARVVSRGKCLVLIRYFYLATEVTPYFRIFYPHETFFKFITDVTKDDSFFFLIALHTISIYIFSNYICDQVYKIKKHPTLLCDNLVC